MRLGASCRANRGDATLQDRQCEHGAQSPCAPATRMCTNANWIFLRAQGTNWIINIVMSVSLHVRSTARHSNSSCPSEKSDLARIWPGPSHQHRLTRTYAPTRIRRTTTAIISNCRRTIRRCIRRRRKESYHHHGTTPRSPSGKRANQSSRAPPDARADDAPRGGLKCAFRVRFARVRVKWRLTSSR